MKSTMHNFERWVNSFIKIITIIYFFSVTVYSLREMLCLQKWVYLRDFPGGSVGKESACSAGDLGLVTRLGSTWGERMATHSNILAWEIPFTEKPGRLQCIGSYRVRHDGSDLAHMRAYIHVTLHSNLFLVRLFFNLLSDWRNHYPSRKTLFL